MRSVQYLFTSSDIFLHVSGSTTATVNDCCWLLVGSEHPLFPTKKLHDGTVGQQQSTQTRLEIRWKLQMSALYLNCRKVILFFGWITQQWIISFIGYIFWILTSLVDEHFSVFTVHYNYFIHTQGSCQKKFTIKKVFLSFICFIY